LSKPPLAASYDAYLVFADYYSMTDGNVIEMDKRAADHVFPWLLVTVLTITVSCTVQIQVVLSACSGIQTFSVKL
jgi:hypothetical protein